MIVCAAFVRAKDIKILKQYGVNDSKKLTDAQIMEIGKGLSKKVFVSKLTLSNEKYNELIKTFIPDDWDKLHYKVDMLVREL